MVKMMRVAIQLYGHLRSFQETYASLFDYIIEPNRANGVEFDIFIHTWDEFDAAQKPMHYEKNEAYAGLKISQSVRDEVTLVYAPKACTIESQIALTPGQKDFIRAHNFNVTLCEINKNTSHTFCNVNRLRQSYENAHNIVYDLVIITRPDIIFYRPLDLMPFFKKEFSWQFFDADALKNYVFSTYINGVHAVIRPDKYVAGIDLLLMAVPDVCNQLAQWEIFFDDMMNQAPEYALIQMMNRHGLKQAYFIYEKDKCWTIVRLGAKQPTFINKIVNNFYGAIVPLLLQSRLFCQQTYTNVTTTQNATEFKKYLKNHLAKSHPKRSGSESKILSGVKPSSHRKKFEDLAPFASKYKIQFSTSLSEKLGAMADTEDLKMKILKMKVLIANQEAHDRCAPGHTRAVPYMSRKNTRDYIWNLIEQTLKEHKVQPKGAKVLEVACGTGTFVNLFQKLAAESYDGIDISTEMLKIAARENQHDNVRFYRETLEDYSRSNANTYDVIVSSSFLHHLVDLEMGFVQIQNMLKPGGIYIGLHEVNTGRTFNKLELFDLELSCLLGYQGHGVKPPLERIKYFIEFLLPNRKFEFLPNRVGFSAENRKEVDYVDYQLNFDFDLSNNEVAKKYGKVIPYCYYNFVEFRHLKETLNHDMFVMTKV